jgi:hypothetical protein
VFVIDDFNPETTRTRKEELEQRFSRIASDVGNQTGRRRIWADLGTRLEFYPRGLVLSTGEHTPTLSSSHQARILPVPFDPGAIDPRAYVDCKASWSGSRTPCAAFWSICSR